MTYKGPRVFQSTPLYEDEAQRNALAAELLPLYGKLRAQGAQQMKVLELRILMEDGSVFALRVLRDKDTRSLHVYPLEYPAEESSPDAEGS